MHEFHVHLDVVFSRGAVRAERTGVLFVARVNVNVLLQVAFSVGAAEHFVTIGALALIVVMDRKQRGGDSIVFLHYKMRLREVK